MSLPPERISIKRRRQEEPVDTLVLEQATSSNQSKRRFTEYFFQRLRQDADLTNLPTIANPTLIKQHQRPRQTSEYSGIPSVRATAPGDEKRDFAKLQALQKSRKDNDVPFLSHVIEQKPSANSASEVDVSNVSPDNTKLPHHIRRFHLSRDLSSILKPRTDGGIRKHKANIRPPLATFIERHSATFHDDAQSIHKSPPVDRILAQSYSKTTPVVNNGNLSEGELQIIQKSDRTSTNTFKKARVPVTKHGQSIKDHPSTWDLDSEQLADELAALAMELDPVTDSGEKSKFQDPRTSPLKVDLPVEAVREADDYIFETYIRVRNDNLQELSMITDPDIGVLIIDEDDQDLWQRYVESDDESDWDEEDSNAEDNPANDYPEDEVSSDDEYGHNVYKHRTYGSDDEQFDDAAEADW